MKRVRLTAEARSELLKETAYYEKTGSGTGRRFRQAVEASIALILAFPAGGAPAAASTRRSKVRGFPFTVIYREAEHEIVVFAIAADRRKPGYWLERVE